MTDILRTNQAQMDMMVAFMLQNSDFARGKMRSLKFGRNPRRIWTTLTQKLNAIGPPERDSLQWRRVWHSLTSEVRRKIRKREECLETGEEVARTMKLTSNQAKVARLMEYKVPEWGKHRDPLKSKLSYESEEEMSQDIFEESSEETPIPRNIAVPTKQESQESEGSPAVKRSLSKQFDEKIQRIEKTQERFLQIMENLSTVILSSLQELVELKRESLQIEREKLQLMKK